MLNVTMDIPDELAERINREATGLGITPAERIIDILEGAVAPAANFVEGKAVAGLAQLRVFLNRIPGLTVVSVSKPSEPQWWVKMQIALDSPIAWHVIQHLGFVLNYISLDEPLPTVFRPVSSPPYLNGGPDDHLAWVIEAKIPFLSAAVIADILADRLPDTVEVEAAWLDEEAD